ncbi:MAG: TRAP transporter permease, partial [Paracoccaceae bacterium]|nr:TRAP transporter permease [Paracoccaceae bacterium]
MSETDDSPLRSPTGLPGRVLAIYCAALSASHLLFALYPGIISEFQRNVLHFAGFVLLASALYPLIPSRKTSGAITALDLALGALTALSAFWF